MASIFCNLTYGSGLSKLSECLMNQSCVTRSHPIGHLSVVKRSSRYCHSTQRYFKRTCIKQPKVYQQCGQHQTLKSRAKHCDSAYGKEDGEDISKATLIWRAVKLPIYSVALVPLTVGSAAAYLQTGQCSAGRYFVLLASSILIITWLNLSNDVYDFDTGADNNKKESVVNIVGSRTGTLITAYLLLALGFMGLTWVSIKAGNMRSILLLACAIVCGYIYQCPPYRLSYQGLGEPLCFGAFGPFATTAFYLLQSSTSQINGDRAVGKMSPLVRLGTKNGFLVVKVAVISLYSLLIVFGIGRALPFTCIFLCALTLPMGKLVVSYVQENHEDKTKIFMAKYYCVRLHALFGAALAAGLVAARMVSRRYTLSPLFP